ncbi:MAG: FAD-binding oxidoreductase [Candidatus Hydrogenedens sp.]|nr:FAD-binding oxidoreductase [Candidatus Hydrogenedens sp.]
MAIDRKLLRWNGWGWNGAPGLRGMDTDAVWAWIGRVMGADPLPRTPVTPLSEITLPPPRLDRGEIAALEALLSPDRVKTDHYERAFHALGKSYHDLLWLRAGNITSAPDAVLYPLSAEETLAVVRHAARENIAVVPYGGGSSMVGGVNALAAPGQRGVVTLDMTLMDQVLKIDETSLVARVQAGAYGPQLEEALQARGFTLGHYPQSFEFSTLGGWIAPRSAGHQSNKYGKAEHWLVSARLASPCGLWETEGFPGSAAGPQLRDLVAGSEGVLGVITDAVVKIHRVPEVKDYRGYLFPSFGDGVEAAREMMQSGVPNAMIRLSDLSETHFYSALDACGAGADESVLFCAMLVGLEGDAGEVAHNLERSKAIIKLHNGIHMGETPGRAWYEKRFLTPYLRDPMMDRGLGVDTLETATRWSNIARLHGVVTGAIVDALEANPGGPGMRGIVMSHISHCYRDGASLYFTFAFPRALDREVDQWLAVKRAASDAVAANGGTISHHHGVGVDHLPWVCAEKGGAAMDILRAAKRSMDPAGVMNPGKLLPPQGAV